jgi:hypothetical protein
MKDLTNDKQIKDMLIQTHLKNQEQEEEGSK